MWRRIDVVDDAESRAARVMLADRRRYEPFLAAAEKFASARDIVLGGIEAPPGDLKAYSRPLELFSGAAIADARALADALYAVDPDGLGHYTCLKTPEPGHSFAVSVDGRDLVTVTSLPLHRGVRLADVVIAEEAPARFSPSITLRVMPPELQLVRVYAGLCNPARAADWPDLLAAERSLRAAFEKGVRARIAETVRRTKQGGSAPAAGIVAQLREEFAADPGRVLIGAFALAALGVPRTGRLQVVSTYDVEHEVAWLENFAARLSPRRTLGRTVNDPKVPTDPRIRRMTVSFSVGRDRPEPLLDVYFSGEITPFAGRDRTRVGTPFVLMRFRLIDMWTIAVLMRMRVVNAEYGRGTLHGMLDDFLAAAACADDPARPPAELLPTVDYVGRAEDPGLARKRATIGVAGARFIPPYYPARRKTGGDATDPSELGI
jgi:hypothetical protein